MFGTVKVNTPWGTIEERDNSYRGMIRYCCTDLVLNNHIVPELESRGFEFEEFNSSLFYDDESGDMVYVYQQYIIDGQDAERLAENTNEIVLYCDKLDLYILCVTHYGTCWDYVPASWKNVIE